MSFFDISKSIEQVVYSIALWVILIPKTIYLVLFHPAKIPGYIQTELRKEEKEQFSDQVSPLIFWLLLVVVPAYMIIRNFAANLPEFALNKPENYFYYILSTLLAFLLTPAIIFHFAEKKSFNRDALKESVYLQCYLQSPFALMMILLCGLLKYLHYDFNAMNAEAYQFLFNKVNGWKDLIFFVVGIFPIYVAYLEYKILKLTGKPAGRALGLVLLSGFLSMFAMFITAGLGYILFYGIR
jgi:hypothetical protein